MLKITIGILIAALLLTGCAATAETIDTNSTRSTTATTDPTATTKTAEPISADEAKAIALKHAALTAEQVTGLRAELDRDDGRLEWDVDFHYDGFEYDYTIHAESGKILDADKDRDD